MDQEAIRSTPSETPRPPLRGFLLDILLNAAIPWVLYRQTKRYLSASEVAAQAMAATFPLATSAVGLVRRQRPDATAWPGTRQGPSAILPGCPHR